MKLLQRELTGEHRTILFRDPAEQREQFRSGARRAMRRNQAVEPADSRCTRGSSATGSL